MKYLLIYLICVACVRVDALSSDAALVHVCRATAFCRRSILLPGLFEFVIIVCRISVDIRSLLLLMSSKHVGAPWCAHGPVGGAHGPVGGAALHHKHFSWSKMTSTHRHGDTDVDLFHD